MYLFLTFISYPSSLACLQFQESLSCLHKLKEFIAIFLSLLEESFCTGLSRSHVFAQLFCFVITTATRNNIVKWYLHEKANALNLFWRCARGREKVLLQFFNALLIFAPKMFINTLKVPYGFPTEKL